MCISSLSTELVAKSRTAYKNCESQKFSFQQGNSYTILLDFARLEINLCSDI